MTRAEIIDAIRRAGRELGRAPSRPELKRLTGVSHYRVLAEFRTLREAIRTAGLEPSRKGQRISTEELIKDWERVRKKLGRRPSRSEYVREGRYSAGALTARFGTWSSIGKKTHHGDNHPDTEARRKDLSGDPVIGRPGDRKTNGTRTTKHKGHEGTQSESGRLDSGRSEDGKTAGAKIIHGSGHGVTQREVESGDKAIAFKWATSLTGIPGPLAGKRRVTEAIAAMVVNTLLGANSNWQLAIGQQQNQNHFTAGDAEDRRGRQNGAAWNGLGPRRFHKDRPVMGAPFDRRPLTNAPANEMGVVFLFALVAADLGFQVESLWGRFPDGHGKREVAPGKWQDVRIEFEFESKNFALHGHDPKGCDVIVCWRHNWKGCPEEIEVVELCRLFGQQ
jgi:HNH endonuclease